MLKITVLFCFIFLCSGILAHLSEDDQLGFYEIKKGDFSVKITNYGARIVSVMLPDRNGTLGDVVLGYDTIGEYTNDTSYFGAIVGRVANRIAGANFTLNGSVYNLDANEKSNTLHGGKKGFSQVAWNVVKHEPCGPSPHITLTYNSVDGEEGFPGDVVVSVTYTLVEPYRLLLKMKAKALNKATPISLAQHTYWNLGGHSSGDILSDKLQMFASNITPVVSGIPTGQIESIAGTAYDFLEPQVIGYKIKQLNGSVGFDINYVVDSPSKGRQIMKPVAVVYNEKSGRIMKLSATAPGVQLYTGNWLNKVGKDGYGYQSHAGLCLETQGFPDSVNHPNFPSQIVEAGHVYEHKVLYEFSTK